MRRRSIGRGTDEQGLVGYARASISAGVSGSIADSCQGQAGWVSSLVLSACSIDSVSSARDKLFIPSRFQRPLEYSQCPAKHFSADNDTGSLLCLDRVLYVSWFDQGSRKSHVRGIESPKKSIYQTWKHSHSRTIALAPPRTAPTWGEQHAARVPAFLPARCRPGTCSYLRFPLPLLGFPKPWSCL
jgi:hypothetical protein